jgi:transcriptional regulator with XRE-family HTH domain
VHVVDWPKLARALTDECARRGLMLKDAAAQMGVSASGLSRLRSGRGLSGDGLAALVGWLDPDAVPQWVTTRDRAPTDC